MSVDFVLLLSQVSVILSHTGTTVEVCRPLFITKETSAALENFAVGSQYLYLLCSNFEWNQKLIQAPHDKTSWPRGLCFSWGSRSPFGSRCSTVVPMAICEPQYDMVPHHAALQLLERMCSLFHFRPISAKTVWFQIFPDLERTQR